MQEDEGDGGGEFKNHPRLLNPSAHDTEAIASNTALMKIYDMLLEQTRGGIQSKVRELDKVDSVNGPDAARFKN